MISLLAPKFESLSLWKDAHLSSMIDQHWIQGELVDLSQGEAQEVVQFIQETAKQLTGALDAASRVLRGPHSEDRLDLVELVKNMPVPEPKFPAVLFRRPSWFAKVLGLARRQTESQLKRHTGIQLPIS